MGRSDDLGQYAAELERLQEADRARDEQQARERERQEQFERAVVHYIADRLPPEPMSDAERRAVTATLEDEARERLAGGMPDGCQRGSRFSLADFRAERAALLDRLDALEGEVRPLRALARARRARHTDGQAPSQDGPEERAPRVTPEDAGASLATLRERIAELETEVKSLRPLAAGQRPAPTVGGASAPYVPPRVGAPSKARAADATSSSPVGRGPGRQAGPRRGDVPRPTMPPGPLQRKEARDLVRGPKDWQDVSNLEDQSVEALAALWDMGPHERGKPIDEEAFRAAGWADDAIEIWKHPYRYELGRLQHGGEWLVRPATPAEISDPEGIPDPEPPHVSMQAGNKGSRAAPNLLMASVEFRRRFVAALDSLLDEGRRLTRKAVCERMGIDRGTLGPYLKREKIDFGQAKADAFDRYQHRRAKR